jgi:hypothetical protein
MARTMKKFSAGGAQGKYDRRMADIKKDFEKDSKGKSGRALEVLEAKRAQRIADAEDDRAKRTGADRTATRKAEYDAEKNLSRTRKFGADKPVAKAEPAKTTAPAAAPAVETAKAKPSSFKEAFKDARSRLGAGKTFTFNGKSYTTNIAGEGRKPTQRAAASTNNSAGTSSSSTNRSTVPAATTVDKPKNTPIAAPALIARNASSDAQAAKVTKPKAEPAKPKESAASLAAQEAAERARMAKLKGNQGRLARLADITGFGKANALDQRAKVAAQQERIAQEQGGRAKAQTTANQQRAAAARKEEFINRKVEGETGLQRIARINRETAAMAKGGKVKKEKTMKYAKGGSTSSKPPQPTAAERAAGAKFRKSVKDLKVTPENAAAIGRGNRSTGMAKGGKMATKFGAAMKKKSADTKGRAMMKFAKGGSIDGCAVKGKTKTSMVKMKNGGSC